MKLKKCPNCKIYTLREQCAKCNTATSNVAPARYSPQDHYGKYRRMMKEKMADG